MTTDEASSTEATTINATQTTPTGESVSEGFAEAWAALEADWDNEKLHHAALELAKITGEMPILGGRYRAIVERNTERSAYAKKRIDALVLTATLMLQSERTEPQKPSRWLSYGIALLCGAAVLWVARTIFNR
jgi:hypothetical protein